ncbi:MAG: hypothetical protein FJY47_05590, partial [Betaproteobacteria bacterium]|nr:hypothetical protein [Betaproteobacteria bacterium]
MDHRDAVRIDLRRARQKRDRRQRREISRPRLQRRPHGPLFARRSIGLLSLCHPHVLRLHCSNLPEGGQAVKKIALAIALAFAAGAASTAQAQEKSIRISGFGAKSGVVRSFGINGEAAMLAAADQINKAGGVKLADGSKAKIVVDYYDDRCTAEEGISVIRRIAGTDSLVAVGPTCSNVAEPLFGILQKKVDD